MKGKDAKRRFSGWRSRKTHLSLLVCVGVAIAVAAVARFVAHPGSAQAQATRARTAAPVARTASRASLPHVSPQSARTAANTAQASQQPGVAAIVNGKQITDEQLGQECLRRFGEEVLESIVNKHLIWQACQQRGVTITEQDVEDEINQMAGNFGLSTDRWLTMLEQERDISPSEYRREIIWPTLALRRLAAAQIEVTDEELQKAFQAEYGPKVKVRLISVSSLQKAEQLQKQAAAAPDTFGDLAKEHSEDANSASARGLIPPIRRFVGPASVEEVAFGLQEGQVSPVVSVANQHLILKCEKHIPETYISSEHLPKIESRLRDQLRDQKLRTAAAELFEELQTNSEVINVFNDPQRRQQMPGVAATINGQPITLQQLTDECVRRHGKEVIEGEINRLVLEQALAKTGITVAQTDVDREIGHAADAYGYLTPEGNPDIQAWLKAVTETEHVSVDTYVRDAVWPSVALKLLVKETVDVSKDDLEKGFAANYGERVEVLAIVLSSQRQANMVWEMARNNPTEAFFGELASQYSIEPVSRANFGKVPPIRRFSGQPIVEDEAFGLEAGEISGVLVVGSRYIILKCLGRTEPVVQDFAAVEPELRKDLYEKKLRLAMAREFDRLRESAQVDNFIAGTSQPGGARSGSTTQTRTATAPSPTTTTTQRR
jgi:parvulin-like peptidyl-prolyl isomerase